MMFVGGDKCYIFLCEYIRLFLQEKINFVCNCYLNKKLNVRFVKQSFIYLEKE